MDIRSGDLRLLLALDALLTELNVTRAAERLHISQPAMSAQLARLRHLFDDPLLVPSGRQMVPTSRALSLQEPLHHALEDLTQLVRDRQSFDPATSQRTFRIIAPDYLHMALTCPLIQAAEAVAPEVKFALLPFEQNTAWSMLEAHDADLLLAWKQATPIEAKARHIYDEKLSVIQRTGHPRGTKKLTLAAYCKLKHLVVSQEGQDFRGPIDEELEKSGRQRQVIASAASLLVAPSLIAKTDLVASIPSKLAFMMDDTIDQFDLPLPGLNFEILASWHPRLQNDPAHQWVRNLVVSSFSKHL